jgi:hypothetical protein
MGRALSGGGRAALLARIEGDWHRERRVRKGEEHRRAEKPADSRAAGGTQRTYDPRRQQGVSVFHEGIRSFSVGDRIQFTAPANNLRVANRELGTIESID